MKIEQSIINMYEKTRTTQLKTALQKTSSDIQAFAHPVEGCNGKMWQLPFVGTTEVNDRTTRHQDIVADELLMGQRCMRPRLFEKFLAWSTDDPKFMAGLAFNTTTMVKELGNAATRAKDPVLMGTCIDRNTSSPTNGEYIIQKHNTLFNDAVNGSPYKAGTTGGLLGPNYVGEDGLVQTIELPFQPYIDGSGLIPDWSKYTASTHVDLKRTNVIPVNYTLSGTPGGASGLNEVKVMAGVQALKARYASGTICLAITYKQVLDLMTNEKLQSILYGHQVLKNGMPDSLMGVRLVVTDALPLVNVGTTAAPKYVRVCPMWVAEDLIYGVWENARFHMKQPDPKIDTLWVGVTFGLGASRTREETVVSILCDEGFTPKSST